MNSGQAENADFEVAQDGSGDFTTVQAAIDAVPDFRINETIIFIKNGTYKEKLVLATSKTNVTFIGEDAENTVLTYDDYASRKNRFGEELGTTGSSGFLFSEILLRQGISRIRIPLARWDRRLPFVLQAIVPCLKIAGF